MKPILISLIALGTTGCVASVSDSAICAGQNRPIAALRAAMTAHPETPEAVGEAGTRVVLRHEAGCGE